MHLTATTSILDRPGFAPVSFALPASSKPLAAGPLAIPNPELDPLVAQQARFRVEGSGPLSARQIVPVSQGARELVAARSGVTDAVRGVLRLVEHAAGGPERSTAIPLNGIAFANSPRGHGANTWRAHMDDDTVFQASIARARPAERAGHVAELGRQAVAESLDTKANVVAGWVNVGPTASGALLARADVVIPGYNDHIGDDELGQAIRILRHEAQHAADPTNPKLEANGAMGLREALAEAHSTSLANLAPARRVLGLDGVVSDQALQRATAFRPYAAAERTLAGALRVAGLEPAGNAAGQLVTQPSDVVAEQLVARLSTAVKVPPKDARHDLAAEFARTLGRRV